VDTGLTWEEVPILGAGQDPHRARSARPRARPRVLGFLSTSTWPSRWRGRRAAGGRALVTPQIWLGDSVHQRRVPRQDLVPHPRRHAVVRDVARASPAHGSHGFHPDQRAQGVENWPRCTSAASVCTTRNSTRCFRIADPLPSGPRSDRAPRSGHTRNTKRELELYHVHYGIRERSYGTAMTDAHVDFDEGLRRRVRGQTTVRPGPGRRRDRLAPVRSSVPYHDRIVQLIAGLRRTRAPQITTTTSWPGWSTLIEWCEGTTPIRPARDGES